MKSGLVKRLQDMLRKSREMQESTSRQLASPAADTLTQISGGGAPRVLPGHGIVSKFGDSIREMAGYPARSGEWGVYVGAGDMMAAKNRQTLIHEMGHRRETKEKGLIGQIMSDKRFSVPDTPPATAEEKQARGRIDSYYQVNSREGYAQAFKTAYNILDLTRNDPNLSRQRMAKVLAHYEARFPGTGILVKELLNEPIYREHPARQILR